MMKILYTNGKIYTMEKEHETVEAVLTENDKVLEVGNVEQLKPLADQEIDLQGAVLYPGFIDSHMHLIGHGEKLRSLNLASATSQEEMFTMIRQAAASLKDGEWLVGEGWNENNFKEPIVPTRFQLDELCDAPIILSRTCRHAALANSKALELANITDETEDPVDGEIVRDETGGATGYLLEGAQDLVFNLLEAPSVEELTAALETAVEDVLSLGLTGAVTDDLGYYGDYRNPFQAYKNVIGTKKKFRAYLMNRSPIFRQIMEEKPTYNEPWMMAGEMKFFIDGALGGQTALLRAPYADAPHTSGMAVHSDAEIEALVQLARSYEQAVAVHVIGDGAVEKILTVLEKYPVPTGKKDRLIHVNVLGDDLVERMLQLPVVLDLQPTFIASDFPWVMERLGEDRWDWAYAWKSLIDKGFICGAGSDAPIEEADPLIGIYAAVTRRKIGDTHEGYLVKEKLSRYEAIQLFTTGSAATIGMANRRGKIAKGYDADFTVFDRDLMTVPVNEILEAKVKMTIVAGEMMYKASRE